MENFAAYGKDLDVAFPDRQGATRPREEHLMAALKDEGFFAYRLTNEGGIQEDCEVNTSKNPFVRPYQVIPEIGDRDSSYGISNSKGFESDTEIRSTSASLAMSLGLFNPEGAENNFPASGGYKTSTLFASPVENQKDQIHSPVLQSITERQRHPLPKQTQGYQMDHSFETPNKGTPLSPQVPLRVARPPGEGRGRNQLLPRYWPRITDHELQQITARDSNCTITPLFEKMLSASDAGRIGRLVLPKACAEAYFPPISQPEGLPLKIQDVSGKDWIFQFRFWPNNNSRMYVLEGVTPCIQSMHLQAGDTVTFSRLDPEGKLVMGYRRAPNSLNAQDTQANPTSSSSTPIATMSTGNIDGPTSFAGITSLLPNLVKGAAESQSNVSSQFSRSDTGYAWLKSEKGGPKKKNAPFHHTLLLGEKKKAKHPPIKSKRVQMDVSDNVEFRITWEEAQDLLRSPPSVTPTVVTIEGYEFEEFEEPPVFGKRTIFTIRTCGFGEDQWVQCDDCASWRRVPADVFLPIRWTCDENVWDAIRNSCTAPQEVESEEIDSLLENMKENRKADVAVPLKVPEAVSGLEALANAATAGENNAPSLSPPAATTKHPRHRPGCTCIVCIQPPSGKGPKHKPTCNCNVCMTVKRRFKTLMLRRKNRQSEREAENASRKKKLWPKEGGGDVNTQEKWHPDKCNVAVENVCEPGNVVIGFGGTVPWMSQGDRMFSSAAFAGAYASQGSYMMDGHLATSSGGIDLNSQPEEMSRCGSRGSMIRLLKTASFPLDSYLNEHGLSSLVCPPQMLVPSASFATGNASDRNGEEYNGYQSPAGAFMSYDS